MHWHRTNYQVKGSPIKLGNWLSKISSGQQFKCLGGLWGAAVEYATCTSKSYKKYLYDIFIQISAWFLGRT